MKGVGRRTEGRDGTGSRQAPECFYCEAEGRSSARRETAGEPSGFSGVWENRQGCVSGLVRVPERQELLGSVARRLRV